LWIEDHGSNLVQVEDNNANDEIDERMWLDLRKKGILDLQLRAATNGVVHIPSSFVETVTN
jgi:hypothetical protein